MYRTSPDLISMELSMMSDEMENGYTSFTEGGGGIYEFIDRFEAFIRRICNTMKDYIQRLIIDMKGLQRKKEFRKKLEEIREGLKNGTITKKVSFINPDKVIDVFGKNCKKFQRNLDAILAMPCNSPKDIDKLDDKIKVFMDDLTTFDTQIKEVLSDKIEMEPSQALNYINSILSSQNQIYNQYFRIINSLEKFESEARRKIVNRGLQYSVNIEYFKKTQGLIQRVSSRVSKGLRNTVIAIALIV